MAAGLLALAAAVIAFAESPSPSAPPSSSPTASASGTPSSPGSAARTLRDADLTKLIVSVYMIDRVQPRVRVEFVRKPPTEMPPQDPLVHYAGRGPNDEAYVWMSADLRTHHDTAFLKAYDEAETAALLAVAMERGAAGPDWQRRYEDAPDKVTFTHGFAHAWSLLRERTNAKARSDIAWVHANVKPGMTRTAVYALLKRRGLVATNDLYNPGRSTGRGTCEYVTTERAAQWPRAGQPLPHTPCAQGAAAKALAHPAVSINYTVGSNIACGTGVTQTFAFGAGDKLISVTDSKESTTCL